MRRFAMIVLAGALVLGAVACGGDGNGVEVKVSDGGVSIGGPGGGGVQVSDGGVTVEGPSGSEVNLGTGDYPEGWPSDFPVPDGVTPVYSVGSPDGVAVWFGGTMTADEVKSFYTDALPAAGYTIDSQADYSDSSGSYTVMSLSGNGWTGGIYAGEGVSSIAAGFEGSFAFWVTLSKS
jgi:hypothetical protein